MYKKIKTIMGVILVAAIGSLLYDVLLKDIFFFLGTVFVKIATFISRGYLDYLYSDVGKATPLFEILPSLFLILLIIFSPLYFYRKIMRIYDKNDNLTTLENPSIRKPILYLAQKKTRMKIFILIWSLPIIILYTDLLIKETATMKVCNQIERNLEIIAPYIEEHDYLVLRSDYRQVDDKEKLISLLAKIQNIGAEKKIDLHEIKLLGL